MSSFVRTILAVIAGVLLAYGLPWTLERILVESYAGGRPMGAAAYFDVRNTPLIMFGRVLMAFMLSVLSGHIAARIAKYDAERTVAIAAAAISMVLIWDYTGGEFAWGTPIWMRIAIVLLTGPSMVLGAIARARAAEVQAQEAAAQAAAQGRPPSSQGTRP